MFLKWFLSVFVFLPLFTPSPALFGQQAAGDNSRESVGTSLAIVRPSTDSTRTESSPVQERIKWYTFIQNIPRDWSQWAQTSFRQDRIGDWAIVTGLTAALFVTDDITYTPSKHLFESSGRATYWSNFAAEIGDGRTQFGLAGAFAAYGLVFGDQRSLRTGSQIVEVVLGAGAIVQVLKHVTGRESPFTRSSPTGIWKFFPDQIQYHKHVPAYDAFPSGHICTSMATVIVVAENYPEATWIRPVGYLFCTFIAVGMANNGIHWYSDYPLGIFLGYSFGMIASHQERFTIVGQGKDNSPKLSLTPGFTRFGPGLNLNVTF
ncbi:MAG TPA: phosphatase PAP2 family protein [Bacteroidota bacterium]